MEPIHALEVGFFFFLGEIPHLLCNQKVIANRIQSAFHFV
jgi:hypothetical protein